MNKPPPYFGLSNVALYRHRAHHEYRLSNVVSSVDNKVPVLPKNAPLYRRKKSTPQKRRRPKSAGRKRSNYPLVKSFSTSALKAATTDNLSFKNGSYHVRKQQKIPSSPLVSNLKTIDLMPKNNFKIRSSVLKPDKKKIPRSILKHRSLEEDRRRQKNIARKEAFDELGVALTRKQFGTYLRFLKVLYSIPDEARHILVQVAIAESEEYDNERLQGRAE